MAARFALLEETRELLQFAAIVLQEGDIWERDLELDGWAVEDGVEVGAEGLEGFFGVGYAAEGERG